MTQRNFQLRIAVDGSAAHTATIFRYAHWFYIATIGVAPFYFGGDRILSWGIAGVLNSGLFLFLICLSPQQVHTNGFDRRLIRIAGVLFFLIILWALLQLLPMSHMLPAHPVWLMTADIIKLPINPVVSIAPDESALTIVKLLVLFLVVANGSIIYSHSNQSSQLVAAIAWITSGYAVLALIWLQYFPGQHIWVENSKYAGNAVSTFINRNGFAQYLGIGLVCALAVIIRNWRMSPRGRTALHQAQNLLLLVFQRSIVYFALALLLAVTLVLTGSRAGVAASMLGIVVLAIIHMLPFRNRNFLIIIPACLFMGFAYFVALPHMADLDQRGQFVFMDWELRSAVYSEIWNAILREPLTGYGLGSFEVVFREAKPMSLDIVLFWQRAHNVYLEAWLGLGLPFGTALILICFLPAGIQLVRIRHQKPNTIGHVVIAVTVLAGIHSLFDFSTQIGGNAITLAALAGAALSSRQKAVKQFDEFI